MDNENLINDQPTPVIEKVSLKEIQEENNKLSPEEQQLANELAESVMAMNEDELKKAVAFLDKKLEILKKINKE